jgi:hypothetical protein
LGWGLVQASRIVAGSDLALRAGAYVVGAVGVNELEERSEKDWEVGLPSLIQRARLHTRKESEKRKEETQNGQREKTPQKTKETK